MSRIGQKPIPVPEGVKVDVSGRSVTVEGPKGKLSWTPAAGVSVNYDDSAKAVTVQRSNDERQTRALPPEPLHSCLPVRVRGG